METLYIDRKQSKLEVKGARLLVHIAQQRPVFSVPMDQVQRVVISTGVELSSTVISKLTQHGVTLICLNPRNTEGCAVTTGLLHNDANRRLAQYRIVSSMQRQLFYAQQLVVGKLTGQRAQLNRALIVRPDRRRQLTAAMNTLGEMSRRCPNSENLEALNGLEGAGAAAYFGAYCSLFAPRLEFTGRNRRPPRDPVNVILSLTYTLLHAEAVRVLHGTGFDPALGFYHKPAYGRESLACDLVELFRARADAWIWRLFADEQLLPEHFSESEDQHARPCQLGKRGREIYYGSYHGHAGIWQRQMRHVAKHWLALVMTEAVDE